MIVTIENDNTIYKGVSKIRKEFQPFNGKNGSHWIHLFFKESSPFYNMNPHHDLYIGISPTDLVIISETGKD